MHRGLKMKLAIMQPYFFPYLGYWQLVNLADSFVVYDDVNYIKNGWINRNRLLINGKPNYFTIPLSDASPFKKIHEIEMQPSRRWREKLLKTVENTYRKSPHFTDVFTVFSEIIRFQTDNLSEYVTNQLKVLSAFLGLDTKFTISSENYDNSSLVGQERVVDICRRENADIYLNLPGGIDMYSRDEFARFGIELAFIEPQPIPYVQKADEFVPNLSIVDCLFAVGREGIGHYFNSYRLV